MILPGKVDVKRYLEIHLNDGVKQRPEAVEGEEVQRAQKYREVLKIGLPGKNSWEKVC